MGISYPHGEAPCSALSRGRSRKCAICCALSFIKGYRVNIVHLVIVKTKCRFVKYWVSQQALFFEGISEGGILLTGRGHRGSPNILWVGDFLGGEDG